MSGLDQMTQRILDSAETQAAKLAADAEAQAGALLEDAASDAEAAADRIAQRSAAALALGRERAKSSAEQQRRTLLLRTRQEIIADTLKKACQTLLSLPERQYFEFLETVLESCVQPQRGVLCLNEADRARMPVSFSEAVSGIAAAHGGSLTVSEETRPIPGGFILIYGGIEENCSIPALFDAKREPLQDLTNRLLFA